MANISLAGLSAQFDQFYDKSAQHADGVQVREAQTALKQNIAEMDRGVQLMQEQYAATNIDLKDKINMRKLANDEMIAETNIAHREKQQLQQTKDQETSRQEQEFWQLDQRVRGLQAAQTNALDKLNNSSSMQRLFRDANFDARERQNEINFTAQEARADIQEQGRKSLHEQQAAEANARHKVNQLVSQALHDTDEATSDARFAASQATDRASFETTEATSDARFAASQATDRASFETTEATSDARFAANQATSRASFETTEATSDARFAANQATSRASFGARQATADAVQRLKVKLKELRENSAQGSGGLFSGANWGNPNDPSTWLSIYSPTAGTLAMRRRGVRSTGVHIDEHGNRVETFEEYDRDAHDKRAAERARRENEKKKARRARGEA